MPKGPLLFATFGLALNLVLWGVPGMVAASGVTHLLLPEAPTLSQALNAVEPNPTQRQSLLDALVSLVGAESEAMQVAGSALQQPTPRDLAPKADAAGQRVEQAARNYIDVVQAIVAR